LEEVMRTAMAACPCCCCTDALERIRTSRYTDDGCTCDLYLPSERCDCVFCLNLRDAT